VGERSKREGGGGGGVAWGFGQHPSVYKNLSDLSIGLRGRGGGGGGGVPHRQGLHIGSPTCPHINNTPNARAGSSTPWWWPPPHFDGWGTPGVTTRCY
jgi:hypothetical protein